MKHVLLVLFSFFALNSNAQIFEYKRVLDKFDDVINEEQIKTLISYTDSTFVFEEKGKTPVTYRVLQYADNKSRGNKENIVNLVDNVYGYQECWFVVLESNYKSFIKAYTMADSESDEELRNKMYSKMHTDYVCWIVHRVVTTQYSHSILGEHYWIQKGDMGTVDRIVYSKIR